jgi:hypothetical protein
MSSHRLRFAGTLFLFLGILALVAVLAATWALPDPEARPNDLFRDLSPSVYAEELAVYQRELVRGWLIVSGAVAGVAVVLLAVVAPRAGYRWFDSGMFLVPLYGQLVFVPRLLWRASARPWPRPRRGAEWIREKARALAAQLQGRPVSQPVPVGGGGPGVSSGVPPLDPAGAPARVSVQGPGTPPPVGSPPTRRPSAAVVGWVFLLLVVAVLGTLGAMRLGRAEERADRLADELRRARADLTILREEFGAMRRQLGAITGRLPPDVPELIGKVRRAVVTVEVPGHGIGSGFAIEADLPDGFRTAILTSEHVVHGAVVEGSTSVLVTQGTRTVRARLGEWDEGNDLALLYVKPRLAPIPWFTEGNEPRVGDFVVAIGSPLGLELSTTVGVISKLFNETIQTDAAINPGNSGGPLLNRFGEVLGINTFSLRGARGIGFALRIDRACEAIVRC